MTTHNKTLRTKLRYIAIDGPIGVGKTSLAKKLAQHLSAQTVLESAASNPWLTKFYETPDAYALHTQLYFLYNRHQQITEIARQLSLPPDEQPLIISDYIMEKERLFAKMTLDADSWQLYESACQGLVWPAIKPDVVIFLQASVPTLIHRIQQRGHENEWLIADTYLQTLSEVYTKFFHAYEEASILMVNSEHIDYVSNDQDFMLLVDRLLSLRSPREFLSRGNY